MQGQLSPAPDKPPHELCALCARSGRSARATPTNWASSIRFPTAALPSTALRPHAVFDDPDTLDFAAHEIARLQKSLRIHEVGDAGRGSRGNHIAGKERHRTACISHQRLDAEIEVRCVTVLPDLPIHLGA